jgi:hypothetical protein
VFPRILVRGSNPDGCPKSKGKRQLYIFFKFSSGSLGHHHKYDRFLTPNKITELPIEIIRNLEIFGTRK